MIPHHDVADLTRQYADAAHDLRDALAERERLVMQWKATGIRPPEMTPTVQRLSAATDVVTTLRETLHAVTGGAR